MSENAELAAIIGITRAMLDAAQAGCWAELGRLEALRAPRLARVRAGDADVNLLHELFALNERITGAAVASRDAAALAWTQRLRSLRGASAYLDVARG